MTLADFCSAVYERNPPITSQTKFLIDLLDACGSSYRVSATYAPKLFKRREALSEDVRSLFPCPIDRDCLRRFLRTHMTPATGRRKDFKDRVREVASAAGLGGLEEIDTEAFLWALTDWLNAIIHTPESTAQLFNYYEQRLSGQRPDDSAIPIPPTHKGDKVDVVRSSSQRDHRPDFWKDFEHQWVLRNIGTCQWIDRRLVCINPVERKIRPKQGTVEIPNSAPSDTNFITVKVAFSARGVEGKATSQWQMQDATGGDCFPGEPSIFNVNATVTNPNMGTK